MTRRPRSHSIGDRAQTRVRQRFEDAGFVVNELPRDYGEDLLVRIFQRKLATPFAFLVQSKGGGRTRKRRQTTLDGGERGYRISVTQRHLAQWRDLALPVLVTYWDENEDETYWSFIPTERHVWPNPTSNPEIQDASISVPITNVLDKNGIEEIRVIVVKRHALIRQMAQCITALINLLSKKSTLRRIECDPANMLIIYSDSQESEKTEVFTFLGTAAELMHLHAERTGLTSDDIVSLLNQEARSARINKMLNKREV